VVQDRLARRRAVCRLLQPPQPGRLRAHRRHAGAPRGSLQLYVCRTHHDGAGGLLSRGNGGPGRPCVAGERLLSVYELFVSESKRAFKREWFQLIMMAGRVLL
jgi:hypothetical protein